VDRAARVGHVRGTAAFEESKMFDAIYLALGLVSFALLCGYVLVCEGLMSHDANV
jgi:hypothetical protein